METIPFLVAIPEGAQAEGLKGFFPDAGASYLALREIPVDRLRENLQAVSRALLKVLDDIKSVGDFGLTEVEIGIEISAEGGVQFVGSSKAGGKGAVKLKFSKP